MREVIVSAASPDGTLRTTPHSVSIITADDIERSTAITVGELLAREPNLNLQSYFGGDKRATIDIRGMGAAAGSNVLVMVDGVRQNESDLSGADLSSIPLSQIERIEILRGGGAVRYGNGAVGGVIDIRTKRGIGKGPRFEASARRESYNTNALRVSGATRIGAVELRLDGQRFDTDGFRANGDVSARDAAASLRVSPTGRFSFLDLYARVAIHQDTSGLPGPVSAAAFASGTAGRRATSNPHDESRTDDRRFTLGGQADLGAAGLVELRWHYRDRENPFVLGFNPSIPLANQRSSIDSRRQEVQLRYSRGYAAFGRTHDFNAGLEIFSADYTRSENGQSIVDVSTRRAGSVASGALFAATTVRASDTLALMGGLRVDRFDTRADDTRFTSSDCRNVNDTVLVDVDPGPGVVLVPVPIVRQVDCVNAYRRQASQGGTWRNHAVELGLTWQARETLTTFASVTRHFRNPNVDELLLASSDLRPQRGMTFETGLRHAASDSLEWSAALFVMRVRDEVFFGADALGNISLNRNLAEPTRRIGGEAELRWGVTSSIAVRASGGYVVPKLGNQGTDLPLVPRVTAAAEVEWSQPAGVRWALGARHVGPRFDGNDFSNRDFPRLPSYTIWDASVRVDYGNFQFSAGIRNLFDRAYATIAYSGGLYPMPERNAFVAVRWTP